MTTRDWPDYGAPLGLAGIYSVRDLGEIAARLGALSRWDRRGNVVYEERFEGSLREWTFLVGAGATGSAVTIPGVGFYGMCSVRLALTGSPGQYASLRNLFPRPAAGLVGIEVCFRRGSGSPRFIVSLSCGTSTWTVGWQARVDLQAGRVYYQNDAGDWVLLGTFGVDEEYPDPWHILKLVGNPSTGAFKRIILDGVEYSVTEVMSISGGSFDGLHPILWTGVASVGSASVDIDSITLTANEP